MMLTLTWWTIILTCHYLIKGLGLTGSHQQDFTFLNQSTSCVWLSFIDIGWTKTKPWNTGGWSSRLKKMQRWDYLKSFCCFRVVAKVLCFVVVVWMCLHLLKVWQWHVPGPTTSLLCLFNKECSHQLRTPHSLSQLLMEIKKVSVFLLEVYLQSWQGQCRLGLIIQFHFQQTKNGEFRLVSDQVGLGLFPCWALLLFGSLPALRFILLREEMFSQSGV